jgi:hypothetical protein
MAMRRFDLRLPLERGEAILLRRVLGSVEGILRHQDLQRGLAREVALFAADELGNIRERLEGLMLKRSISNAGTQE